MEPLDFLFTPLLQFLVDEAPKLALQLRPVVLEVLKDLFQLLAQLGEKRRVLVQVDADMVSRRVQHPGSSRLR